MVKNFYPFLVSFSVLPIAIFSVQRFSKYPIGNTTIWWLIEALILLTFLGARFIYFDRENKRHFNCVKWYLLWILFCIIRGIFMAEIYWDYKALVGTTFALLIPIISYTASNKERLQSILSVFIKYGIPLFILLIPSIDLGVWGWYLFPVSFIMLLFPALKTQWKVILFLISLVAIFGDISVRSHVFKFGIPILIILLYYFRIFIISIKILEIFRKILIITPWVLFLLGVSGTFNIFKINEYIKGADSGFSQNAEGERTQNITDDSRTFMYEEVLNSAFKYNYWLIGRSPARGNETIAFSSIIEEITGKPERHRNEANIPNIFTWMGIVGVLLYFIIFYKASFLAINKSNNIYAMLIGLFVAFRWMYAWIEDPCRFGMNEFVIWLMIGTCFSKSFRKMNNIEVKLWARGIFGTKYVRLMEIYNNDANKTKSNFN